MRAFRVRERRPPVVRHQVIRVQRVIHPQRKPLLREIPLVERLHVRRAVITEKIANAAVKMAQDLHAKAILAFSHTGYTPRLLAKLRPSVPVIAISDQEKTCRKLNLYWGITPSHKEWDTVLDTNILKEIDKYIFENTSFKKDERIIIIGSIPKLITGRTNFIRVHRIGAENEQNKKCG